MGGKETVRGILFQSLICCKELFNRKWNLVKFEPTYININEKKEIEKVDILFSNINNQMYALQVKSSINKFAKPQINRWIKEIKKEIKADFYELHLVGDCKENAEKYVDTINKADNIKIILTSFDVNDIENDILNKAKDFLTENNMGCEDDRLSNNIKIICYELLKNALVDESFSIENIMDMLTSTDNSDLRDFCQLVRDRLSKRIDLIFEFYKSTYSLFGFGSAESKEKLYGNIKKIKNIDNEYDMKISAILNNIEENEKYYAYLCKEYLEYESKSINIFLNDLNTPQEYYHKKYNLTYHLNLRNEINKLVSTYNRIDEKISNKYFLKINQKEPFENQDDIIIQYSDLTELEEKLKKMSFKEQEYPLILVFTDSEKKYQCLDNIIKENRAIFMINENFTEKDMFNWIVNTNEAFTEEGSFSPQLYIRYVIFGLCISKNIKYMLAKFKSRSTIKYIFTEQIKA